jgi:pyruvate/2-oxoacid:ferredoxin oxidoreductase beta subunit
MIKYEELIPYVTEKLLDLIQTKGNPYVGQDQIGANKFIINKVKVLNHDGLSLIIVMEIWECFSNISLSE